MRHGRSIVLFSGGIDSTLALFWALSRHREVHVLELTFPERPRGETQAASKILRTLRPAARHIVALPFLRPGHRGPAGYLPTRNLLYHAIAQSLAETVGADTVVAGHLREDAEEFPDAEPQFFADLQILAARGRPVQTTIRIANPLQVAGVEELARELPIPLAWTWSCWRSGPRPCGRCEKCVRRADLLRRLSPPTDPAWAARTPRGSRSRRGSRPSRR